MCSHLFLDIFIKILISSFISISGNGAGVCAVITAAFHKYQVFDIFIKILILISRNKCTIGSVLSRFSRTTSEFFLVLTMAHGHQHHTPTTTAPISVRTSLQMQHLKAAALALRPTPSPCSHKHHIHNDDPSSTWRRTTRARSTPLSQRKRRRCPNTRRRLCLRRHTLWVPNRCAANAQR